MDEGKAEKKKGIADLYRLEDWWAIWLGALILASVFLGMIAKVPKTASWTWGGLAEAFPSGTISGLIFLGISLGAILSIAVFIMQPKGAGRFFPAFLVLFLLAALVRIPAGEKTVHHFGVADVFWAVALGLLIANTVGTPGWLKPALRSEFYIKTGLVLLGADILFGNILKFGLYGLAIAWGVTPIVIVFMWLFGTKVLKMINKPLVITIAAATSVCGVSAAIAAGAASRAKKEDLTIAIGMSLIFTVLMMVGMPLLVRAVGMNEVLGGAWIGGTVDATGAVVASGRALGPEAEAVAAIIKMIQNVLIGIVAFAIAVYWVTVVEKNPDLPRPGVGEIWKRFPKFILGFLAASLFTSFIAMPLMGSDAVSASLKLGKDFRNWLFVLAFLSIGLDSHFKTMAEQMTGGKPIILYAVGQTFNLVLTLFVAWLVLSGTVFPLPPSLL